VALVLAGCDASHHLTDGLTHGTPPSLSEVWPNDDGRSWTYSSVSRTWDPPTLVYFPTVASVPSVTFDTVAAVFASRPVGANPQVSTTQFVLRFNGTQLLGSGLVAQVLEGIVPPLASGARSYAPPSLAMGPAGLGIGPPSPSFNGPARFLHPGYWRRNSDWIATHDPVTTDTLPNWKYLEADLSPGHEFVSQIVPNLSPDVLLHARVVRLLTVLTPTGAVARGIEVQYFIDWGISVVTDDNGGFLGFQRPFSCASVQYAPGVGPVSDDERSLLYAGRSRAPGAGDVRLTLASTAAGGSVAARR